MNDWPAGLRFDSVWDAVFGVAIVFGGPVLLVFGPSWLRMIVGSLIFAGLVAVVVIVIHAWAVSFKRFCGRFARAWKVAKEEEAT